MDASGHAFPHPSQRWKWWFILSTTPWQCLKSNNFGVYYDSKGKLLGFKDGLKCMGTSDMHFSLPSKRWKVAINTINIA